MKGEELRRWRARSTTEGRSDLTRRGSYPVTNRCSKSFDGATKRKDKVARWAYKLWLPGLQLS